MLGWVLFNVVVLALLALDLGVFHRQAHEVRIREALVWSGVWIALAAAFNVGLYFTHGAEPALEFLAGYVVEKSLAVDNIFVFLMIFAYLGIPARHQHRILFWGILGALVMRAGFIFAGVALLKHFHWMIYVFGGLLVLSAVKLLWTAGQEQHPEKNWILRALKWCLPLATDDTSGRFLVRRNGRWYATSLLAALVFVEVSDLIFAVDSVPAILAITQDPFIVYTSNVLAILGLRAMYFALAGVMRHFHYLHYGLSAVLLFVGSKMLLIDVVKVPITVSLATIAAILLAAAGASFVWPRREPAAPHAAAHDHEPHPPARESLPTA